MSPCMRLTLERLVIMGFSGSDVGQWIIDNIVFVMIVIAGISILWAANTKKVRDAMLVFGLSLLGLLVITLASFHQELGEWVRTTFFNA